MSRQTKRTIAGKEHTLLFFRVLERDGLGRPKKAEIFYDEESVKLQNGDEFITFWVQSDLVDKKGRN